MEKLKTFIVAVVIVGVFALAPVAHGATQTEIKAEIGVWKSYIVKLEAILDVLNARIEALEAQLDTPKQEEKKEVKPAKAEKEYRYTVTLPEGSPVNKPKANMTFEELRDFTANLFHKYESPYNMLINADEKTVLDFLKTNGYKVSKEKK